MLFRSHPVRARADRPAQPGRPELQPPREPIPQFGAGIRLVKQPPQLIPVARVRVIRDPGLDRGPEATP